MVGVAYFFGFFDIVNMGLVIPSIASAWHVPVAQIVPALVWNLYGYIVGSLAVSFFSDTFGRKASLIAAIFLFTAGSIVSALTSSIEWLVIGRFIVGLGDGAIICQVTTYLSELAPAKMRGRYTAIATACAYFAAAVVPFVALLILPNFSWGWRGLLFIGAFGGVAGLIGIKYFVESPRWLVGKGRFAEAELVVADGAGSARGCAKAASQGRASTKECACCP